jgi:hypothetical protein
LDTDPAAFVEPHNAAAEDQQKRVLERRHDRVRSEPGLLAMEAMGLRVTGKTEGEIIQSISHRYGVAFETARDLLERSEAYEAEHAQEA